MARGSARAQSFTPKAHANMPGAEVLETFMTSDCGDACGLPEEDVDEAWLEKLQAAADAALRGEKGFDGEAVFLKRLEKAYEDAMAAGDEEAARDVLNAIRAEGGTMPASACRSPDSTCLGKKSAVPQKPPLPTASPQQGCHATTPREARRARTGAAGCQSRMPANGCSPSPRSARTPRESSGRRGQMREMIAAQLKSPRQAQASPPKGEPGGVNCEDAAGTRPKPQAAQPEQAEYAEEQLTEDVANTGPQKLGSLFCWASDAPPDFLGQAQQAEEQRQKRGGLQSAEELNVNIDSSTLSGSSEQELPPSEAPAICRHALKKWASGKSGGYRCLLDVAAAIPLASGLETPFDDLPGRASWQGIAILCGLPGAEELLTSAGAGESHAALLFSQGPRQFVQETLCAVRSEAGLAESAPMTVEELHLGLRSLELRSRSGEHNDNTALIRSVAGRELLRLRLNRSDGAYEAPEGVLPGRALASALRMSASSVEREARSEALETLREAPTGWEACRSALVAATRMLRDELEALQTYGPYAALGLEYDATDSTIRRAYRDLCLRLHPDKGGDTAVFQSLQQAHDTIMEDRRKGLRPAKPTRRRRQPSKTCSEPKSSARAPEPDMGSTAGYFGAGARESESCSTGSSKAKGSRRAKEAREPAAGAPDTEAQASAEAEELLNEVARLALRAQESARSASEAAKAAETSAAVPEAAADGLEELGEGMRNLLRSLAEVVNSTSSTASLASDTSRRVVAVGILGAEGDKMEEIMATSQRCAEAGMAAADASATCEALARSLADALRNFESAGPALDDALGALAAAARLGSEAAREAAQVAEVASSAVDAALVAARSAVCLGGSPKASGRQRRQHREADGYPEPPATSQNQGAPKGEGAPEDSGGCKGSPGRPPSASGTPPPRRPDFFAAGGGESSRGRPSSRRPETPQGGDPGGARARSSSAGARGRTEALVRRRIEAHEELVKLNQEALKLQQQVQAALLASPLLLPRTRARQRHRVFAVMSEVLLDVVREIGQSDSVASCELLPETLLGCTDSALCDSRAGAIRLAALMDLDMLTSILQGPFLSLLVAAVPSRKTAIEKALQKTVESLNAWVKPLG
eukprot:TRINITY_DN16192_c0_g1_i1.p1 TRINITY_DN16192_c0_g1~~TRINITY_DN16192_c0_g1_i1.p1  ORF type:complete len:1107 (+),score=261.98 TRINITY_DN16192_c0_g1_i1:41-3361(+)